MKAIIYAGIGLFSVATVYGVADYYNSQKKGTLDKLYKEEEPVREQVNTITVPQKNTVVNSSENRTVALNTTVKKAKKFKQPKRTIRLDEFSRGRIIEPIPLDIKPIEPVKEEPVKKEEIKVNEEMLKPEAKTVETTKPERRISLDMFSRAPLKRPVKTEKVATTARTN